MTQPTSQSAEYVGFGMLTQEITLVVERLPEHNTGGLIKEVAEFVYDDAAIVACLLRQWGVRSGLIGTTIGDDPRGRSLARQLQEWGVLGEVRLDPSLRTPLEVDVSDGTGARTYFWQRPEHILATLDSADLSLLQGARLLYVDWYDGDHIVRAMDEAIRLGVPVFLNMEHAHGDPDLLARYASRATICQAVTDAAQRENSDPLSVAKKLLETGVKTVLITLAAQGSLAVADGQVLRVGVPKVEIVDGSGAGATYSAGFIYGFLRGWPIERSVQLAGAAAALKVARAGLQMAPMEEIQALANQIPVQRFNLVGG